MKAEDQTTIESAIRLAYTSHVGTDLIKALRAELAESDRLRHESYAAHVHIMETARQSTVDEAAQYRAARQRP